MIKTIKNFFKKERENENLLAFGQKDWLSGLRMLLEERSDDLQSSIIQKINARCSELKSKADVLLKSELKSANFNDRLIEMIEDNRVNYVKLVKTLCDKLMISADKNLDVKLVVINFSQAIGHFSAETSKTYFSLKDAFYPEMSTIAESIKSLNSLYKELNDSTKEGIGKDFENLKERTREYYSDLDAERGLKNDSESAKSDIEDAKLRLVEAEKRKEALKLSNGFKNISEIYEAREIVDAKISHLKEEIFGAVMNMHDELKLLKNSPNEKLIEKYIQDPASSLLWDETLQFSAVLDELKNALKNKIIEVDSRKRQRLVSSIERMQKRSFLALWLNEYKKLHKEKRDLEDKIGKTPVMIDLSDVDYQISHLKEKIEKKKHLISYNEDKVREMDLLRRKEAIETDLKNFAGKRIILI